MNKEKHTPGPWKFTKIENKYHDPSGLLVTVATVYSGDVAIARCHRIEDAQIISAVPDMAEALNTNYIFLQRLNMVFPEGSVLLCEAEKAWEAIRAALSKAGLA